MLLWRRELSAFFVSPAAYVTTFVVLVVTGMGFWAFARNSVNAPPRVDVLLFMLPTVWLMLLIVATVSTMRSFADEKKSGSFESLMTAPLTESEAVLGKYAACLTFFCIVFLPTLLYLPILARFSRYFIIS